MLMFFFNTSASLVLGCISVVVGLAGIVFFLSKLGGKDIDKAEAKSIIEWLVMFILLFLFGLIFGYLIFLVLSIFSLLFGAPKFMRKLWISLRELPQKFPAAWQKIKLYFKEIVKDFFF